MTFGRATIAILGAAFAMVAGVAVSDSTTYKTVLIIGASYAANLGSPDLPGYRVVNRGRGGWETKDMLARFDTDVVRTRPDAVLIWGHVNNFTRTSPERYTATAAATREHYRQMTARARAAGIEVWIATEVPMADRPGIANVLRGWLGKLMGQQSYAERINAQVRSVNGFLRETAARDGILLFDFEEVFKGEGGVRRAAFATEDGSHISPAGYAALTESVRRTLSTRRKS